MKHQIFPMSLNLQSVIAILLIVLSGNISAVELADAEAQIGLPWTEKFRTNIKSDLDNYNKQKDHKAVAVAVSPNNRRVAFGYAWNHDSQLAAALTAIQSCEADRTERSIEGTCEVVVSNEDIIPLGKTHFDDIAEDAPSNVWHVQLPEGELYVVGTIHVLKPTVFPLPRAYDIAYEAADQIALETNALLMSDPERTSSLQKLAVADAKSLKKQTPRRLKKALRNFAKKHGGNVKSLYDIQPIFTELQIGQIAVLANGYSGATGIEMHYSRKSTIDGKAILELEDFVETMSLMTNLPIETQLTALETTLANYDEFPETFHKILSSWVGADIDELYALSMEPFTVTPELREFGESFLDGRNLGMMERIRPLLTSGKTTTVMVGAAHLGGPNGLIPLLRKEGLNPVQLTVLGEPVGPSNSE